MLCELKLPKLLQGFKQLGYIIIELVKDETCPILMPALFANGIKIEIMECCVPYLLTQQLLGGFEAFCSCEIKSSVLKSGNHESPFDTRSGCSQGTSMNGAWKLSVLQQQA